MFTFISIIVLFLSLYYIGDLCNTYNYDTTYVAPIITMFIYSLLALVRSAKAKLDEWDNYGTGDSYYHSNYYKKSNGHRHINNGSSNAYYQQGDYNNPNEKVQTFEQKKPPKKNFDRELMRYPSRETIRNKIKELEKSRWWRFKRSFAGFFGIDITEKYYRLLKHDKIKKSAKVIQIEDKEDHSRFAPSFNTVSQSEINEYNGVAKYVTRTCEVAILEEEQTIITNISNDKQQQPINESKS